MSSMGGDHTNKDNDKTRMVSTPRLIQDISPMKPTMKRVKKAPAPKSQQKATHSPSPKQKQTAQPQKQNPRPTLAQKPTVQTTPTAVPVQTSTAQKEQPMGDTGLTQAKQVQQRNAVRLADTPVVDYIPEYRFDTRSPEHPHPLQHAKQATAQKKSATTQSTDKNKTTLRSFVGFITSNFWKLCLLGVILLITYVIASTVIIQKHASRIYEPGSQALIDQSANIDVAIVFGGGVHEDGPLPLVKDRLDTAAKLLHDGLVEKIILSGDNQLLEYNEPAVMYEYMVREQEIDPEYLQPDFAGLSTYETCERANKIFGLEKAFLVTESTHLPRALYLCEHFDIEVYGVQSNGISSSGLKVGQRWREVLARSKAIFNVYIYGEQTILGDPIDITVYDD